MKIANDNMPASDEDRLYPLVREHVTRTGRCSISNIQLTFQIGYNHATRLIERMEREGVVSPPPD